MSNSNVKSQNKNNLKLDVGQNIKRFLNLSHQKSIEKQSIPQKHQISLKNIQLRIRVISRQRMKHQLQQQQQTFQKYLPITKKKKNRKKTEYAQKTRRMLPEVGERTKVTDCKSKQKLRTDDKFRIQENIHRKTRRMLPEVGERTKIIERMSKRKLRTDDKFRIQENIHRKTRRTLPQVGERTKITERMSKRKLRTDDKFRIQENIHRKTRRTLPQAAVRIKKLSANQNKN